MLTTADKYRQTQTSRSRILIFLDIFQGAIVGGNNGAV